MWSISEISIIRRNSILICSSDVKFFQSYYYQHYVRRYYILRISDSKEFKRNLTNYKTLNRKINLLMFQSNSESNAATWCDSYFFIKESWQILNMIPLSRLHCTIWGFIYILKCLIKFIKAFSVVLLANQYYQVIIGFL